MNKYTCHIENSENTRAYKVQGKPGNTHYKRTHWLGDMKSRRSTIGNLFLLEKNPIQWTAKWQFCITQSSAEAEVEFAAVASATKEVIWLLKLLENLKLP